jgi:catechol-2,3-dioxygenase
MNKGESNSKIPFPNGGIIGHIHLRVTNLERSIKFYHEKFGLDMTTTDWISMGIQFLSEGGTITTLQLTLYSLNGDVHRDGVTGLNLQ